MKWVRHEERPKEGDTRSRYVFAWKNTGVGKYTVWLEHYEVHERFFQPSGGGPGWWAETGRNTADWYG